jgi:hypothetical protein
MRAVAMAYSLAWDSDRLQRHADAVPDEVPVDHEAERARLAGFRTALFGCLRARADELFELCDAVLCADGPVKTLVGLCLAPEHRRGHGALYAGINHGQIDIESLAWALVASPLPRTAGGRIVLAVDVTCWLRPDAATSGERLFCHVYGRGKDDDQMIPGWPYSMVAALESGPTSWTRLLDARRLRPDDDEARVTAEQVADVVARIIAAGHWSSGDPDILVIVDAGYDVPRLAHRLAGLPVQVLGRLRSDRIMCFPAPAPARVGPGRPVRHGPVFKLGDPSTHPAPACRTTTETTRYGTTTTSSWDRCHPRLTRRAAWIDHDEDLPIIDGTLIRVQAEHLPGNHRPPPMWLWTDHTGLNPAHVDVCWRAYLRRFDIEHTFRLLKQTLGWTAPRLRDPTAADTWTWLIIAAYTQLWLARHLTRDLRRPWEKPAKPDQLTPARIRRGFRHLRQTTPQPARAPKPSRPGPGRPPGTKNKTTPPRPHVGKTTKRDTSHQARRARES